MMISPVVEIILNISCEWGLVVWIKPSIAVVNIKLILNKLVVLVVWHSSLVPHFEVQILFNSSDSQKSHFYHYLHNSSWDISQTTKRLETRHFAVVAGEAP